MKYILKVIFPVYRKKKSGFTLVELLVVITIIGILATISIKTMFNLIHKAKQSEAITYINTCQKKQMAYYAETTLFTDSLKLLGLPNETNNYMYQVEIYPPTQPEDGNQTLACCMAAEKGGNSQMVLTCVSSGS
ncbi:General secretion pathway protein H [Planktothrix tepida]|uniref:General secretion pathway protein H n=2 Tax=Planktothrix TaxID=54304 RepID=A0A1J1LLY6_9CYAN